jgi:hypothetical protein
MKRRKNKLSDELRPQYDLRQLLKGGVRGKYARRYHAGANLVLLEPEKKRVEQQGWQLAGGSPRRSGAMAQVLG